MDQERRFFLSAFLPGALAFCASVFRAAPADGAKQSSQWPQQPSQQPGQPPQIPPIPKIEMPTIDKKTALKEDQKELHKDVDRVLVLAQELKSQLAKTDSTQVLSLSLVQKAKAIEKLAKKIQRLARG